MLRGKASEADHGSLTTNPNKKSKTVEYYRNGVDYLRRNFLQHMKDVEKWRPEYGVDLVRDRLQPVLRLFPSMVHYNEPITSDFGGFDFVAKSSGGLRIAIEWETGNISSSHRSMNKMAIALQREIMDVCVLIVPSNLLYPHLTDRIGNIGELSGYLDFWRSISPTVAKGMLVVTVVEHDFLTDDPSLPYLPTGKAGNANKLT